MQNDVIRMLRYNTGNDKKAFVKFKDNFDAVIFNATIVAYSGSAVADLVSVHKNQYIIDPQTHIMQHDILAIMSKDKQSNNYSIKKSVRKYLEQLPKKVIEIIEKENRPLYSSEINDILDELIEKIYIFETEYVNSFIEQKEYDKYLKYAKIGPDPKVIIAPYFMLKREMENEDRNDIMKINKKCLEKYITYNANQKHRYDVAAQLVIDKEILKDDNLIELIKQTYNCDGYEYLFIWISDFSSFECTRHDKIAFRRLILELNNMGKKPLMSYGGYDSILLSHREIKARLYGVSQSVGYGEARAITPVGGGLPVNKYYFKPLHRRMRFDEALHILVNNGYFDEAKTNFEHAKDYYLNICDCEQCKEIIKDNIDNFQIYNDSVPYVVKARYGEIMRNRPTTEATLVAAFHFLYSKTDEWDEVKRLDLKELRKTLIENFKQYASDKELININEWCDIFAK